MKTRSSVGSLCVKMGIALPNALAILLMVDVAFAGNAPSYRLIDSGFPADERHPPYWIDNEHVIFKGFGVGSYSKEMHAAPLSVAGPKGYDEHGMHTGYYIWDTRMNKVNLYKDKIANLCVEDGNLVYETIPSKDNEKSVVWRGRFGEEKPTNIEPAHWTFYGGEASCWDTAYTRTEEQKGRHIVSLRRGWGYLDVGPSDPPLNANAPVLYYSSGQKEPIKLSIPRSKMWNGGYVLYVPHERSHLIIEGHRHGSEVPEAWFLSPDGKLSEVILPPGPWKGVNLHPVKGGIFISSWFTEGKSIREPGAAYLVPNGEWWRLLFRGVPGRAGISPDGCKVALTVAPDEKTVRESFSEWIAGRPGQKTMRMIDVCKGETK